MNDQPMSEDYEMWPEAKIQSAAAVFLATYQPSIPPRVKPGDIITYMRDGKRESFRIAFPSRPRSFRPGRS